MSQYNPDKPLSAPWSNISSMNTSIVLDHPGSASYTNLDLISGKVILRCAKSVDIDYIHVKLEGESRTRLLSPVGVNGEKPRPQLEYHKILYIVKTVFPKADVLEGQSRSSAKLTLPQGTHEYPFSFKLPFNNTCASDKSQMPSLDVSGRGIEVAKAPTRHVKKTLPPTLSGFPGEAEIRYFLKATVRRHAFWKENIRSYAPFNFFPIEPPRPPASGNEVYARQKHTFSPFAAIESVKPKKSIFGKSKGGTSPLSGNEAPVISVDARLPEPAILTCNDDVPLRVLVKKLNTCDAMLFLQSLQVSLIGSTKIKAHDVYRTESNSWVLTSKSNLGLPIGTVSDPAATETLISDSLWRGQALPNTVAPSFETCNITRQYQLDVRIGISYTGATKAMAKPQTMVLPLRLDCQVFSGIKPPHELLQAMAEARANIQRTSTAKAPNAKIEKLRTEGHKPSFADVPPTPMEGPVSYGHDDFPAQQGIARPPEPPMYDDAPPSYEDAIASNVPPVNSPRPSYAPPVVGEDDLLKGDEKKNFLSRRDSD